MIESLLVVQVLSTRDLIARKLSDILFEVRTALQTLELDGEISITESKKGELYLTEDEPGLIRRFVRNMCAFTRPYFRRYPLCLQIDF